MYVHCERCRINYDDENRWTICPHGPLWARGESYCQEHDLAPCPFEHTPRLLPRDGIVHRLVEWTRFTLIAEAYAISDDELHRPLTRWQRTALAAGNGVASIGNAWYAVKLFARRMYGVWLVSWGQCPGCASSPPDRRCRVCWGWVGTFPPSPEIVKQWIERFNSEVDREWRALHSKTQSKASSAPATSSA